MIPGDVRDGATLNETFEPCDHGGLQEQWDPTFSEHSFGFRPGRSAHQAVAQAQRYVADGYNVVVDLDLERFFDRVNHDILMSREMDRGSWASSRMLRNHSSDSDFGKPRKLIVDWIQTRP